MIKNKRVCINITYDDGLCFIWAILAGPYPVKCNPACRSHDESYFSQLNVRNISVPINLSEKINLKKQNDLPINVFGYDYKMSYPLYITDNRKCNAHLDLLLYKKHFFLIRDISHSFSTFFIDFKSAENCYICGAPFTKIRLKV